MKFILAILVVILVLLQYRLWFGDGGINEVWNLQRDIKEQQLENTTLKERNEALDAEVKDLKQGVAAIEERARSELGMIKNGETFYQAVDE